MSRDHLRQTSYRYKGVSKDSTVVPATFLTRSQWTHAVTLTRDLAAGSPGSFRSLRAFKIFYLRLRHVMRVGHLDSPAHEAPCGEAAFVARF